MKLDHCRSCEAPIIWTVTTNGKRMPVDVDPVTAPAGGFTLDEDEDPPIARFEAVDRDRIFKPVLYISHFATCPNANMHRKPA